MKQCKKCGKISSDRQKFCNKCGTSMEADFTYICNHCGRIYDAGSKVCPKCHAIPDIPLPGTTQTKKPQTSIKYCSNCGQPLSERNRFCNHCGTKVTQ